MTTKSISPAQTRILARKIARTLSPGDTIALSGDLGVGKTTFVKGVLQGFGFPENNVISPSFVLMRTYSTRFGKVHHFDLYRLNHPALEQFADLWEALEDGSSLKIIEWADCIEKFLPQKTIFVEIRFLLNQARKISIIDKRNVLIGRVV